MVSSKSQQVQELKDSGNEAVKAGNFTEAIIHYTYALKVDPTQYQLYSNRSLAFLKLQQYYHALEDANETIKLKPDWAKGYFRKAEVEFQTEQFEDALVSYNLAFRLEQQNSKLIESIKTTAKQIEKTRRTESQIPWFGAAIGFIVGCLIVIGDFVVAENPVLSHPILKVLIVFVMTAIGYGFARLYRYYVRIQRDSLLEPPIDLLGGENENEKPETNGESKKNDEKHRTKASARLRFKKGKR